jgi:DNA-binding CsgD family transcriptional regulator
MRGSSRPRPSTSASPPREAEVLALVAAGRGNRQIAEALFISPKTAVAHRVGLD